jgi:transglutaminase-like putative cysteine protease
LPKHCGIITVNLYQLKMNKRLCLVVLLGLCLSFPCLKAQNIDSLRKQFPNEKAVAFNRSIDYNISLKDGVPYVESHEFQQMAYLTDAATFMSKYSFSHSDFQQVVSYEAYTTTADKRKLKVTDYKTSTDKESFVFYDDVKETSFYFPSVEPGAVGTLDVSYLNKDPHLLSPYYFSGYIPAVNSELKVTVDKNISLKYELMGLDTSNILVTIENKHHNKIYTFQYKNCPSDKSYADAPDFSWYSPHVIVYIENYKDDKGTVVPYLSNEDDLYHLSYGYLKDVNTKVDPELKHIVDSLTVGCTTQECRARNIYSWVQHNIKYVAFEDGMGGFVPRDAGLVCSRRFGDCKDMASILTEMLNVAGVKAYFTWLGTRDLPYTFSHTPLPLVSNHMICTANIDGKYVFLDGTDPTCVFGMAPYAIQDKEVMLAVSDKQYKVLKVPVADKEKNVLTDTTWMELTTDGIKGKVKETMTGYFATYMNAKRLYFDKKNIDEDMKNEFERGSNKFKLDTFYFDKGLPGDKVVLSADFKLPDYAKKIGNEYYLNLNLFKFFVNERIDYPARKVPVAYNFDYVKKYVTILKVPDGFKVTYLPQSKSYYNKVWGFNIHYEQKGNEVIMTQEYDNTTLMLTSDQFAAWNTVLQNLFPLYKETLSLAKD